jgi:GTP-binding protein HflX
MSRTRRWDLDTGDEVMLTDTVGFIRDLPHHLIESFKATLEEAPHADLLLIVLDVSDPSAELHYETVKATLDDLFADAAAAARRAGIDYDPPEAVLLLNKADKLPDHTELLVWQQREPGAIPFCAVHTDGLGHQSLRERLREAVAGPQEDVLLRVPLASGKTIHLLERQGEVRERQYDNGDALLRLRIGTRTLERLAAGPGGIRVESAGRR